MFSNPDFKGQYPWFFFALVMVLVGVHNIVTAWQGLPVNYCRGYGTSKICSEIPVWVSYLVFGVGSWLLYITLRIVFSRYKKRILASPLEKIFIHRQLMLSLASPFVVLFGIAMGIYFFALLVYS